jgi:hypothetical protein
MGSTEGLNIGRFVPCLLSLLCLIGCSVRSDVRDFTVSKWKNASKDDRREMAKDFLEKYKASEMTLEQIRSLLGEPENEHDTWEYNLSSKGAPPRGPQTIKALSEFPQLYVHFKDGLVVDTSVTLGLLLTDGKKFDSAIWKVSPGDRSTMVLDLTNSNLLVGLAKTDVQMLLGSADREGERHELEYHLGYRMLDLVTLTFTVGPDGRILAAQIIEH